MTFDFDDPKYYDTKAVEKELKRVTERCDGCRRCYRLCTPFDFMLDDCVDKNDGDLSKITSADYRKMVGLCWQCKLCFNHCPYTPPHEWNIDFPRLMLRAKPRGRSMRDQSPPAHVSPAHLRELDDRPGHEARGSDHARDPVLLVLRELHGRYRGEGEVTPSMRQELLQDLGKAPSLTGGSLVTLECSDKPGSEEEGGSS